MERIEQLLSELKENVPFRKHDYDERFTQELFEKYPINVSIYDVFLKFYRWALLEISKVLLEKGSDEKDGFYIILHVATFRKLYSAFNLFQKGYVSESLTLIKGVWENILTIIACHKNIIGIDDYFLNFGNKEMDVDKLTPQQKQELREEMRNKTKKLDDKIVNALIREKISGDNQYLLNSFWNILNRAAHQSKLYIARNFNRWLQKERLLYINPYFQGEDIDLIEMNINFLLWCSFILNKTFPFINLFQRINIEFQQKYEEMMEMLDLEIDTNPAKATKAILAFVKANW